MAMRTAAVVAVVMAAGVTLAAVAAPDVAVTQADGSYTVAARFDVPQHPDAVLTVLTDYERIPRYMPEVESSVVRERRGSRVVVEQEAVAKFMFFSRRVHLVLEVDEAADSVRFVDVSGRSFAAYSGAWTLSGENGGTIVGYQLTARPAFDVPSFVLKRLMERDATRMIASLRGEIARAAPVTR